MGNVTAENSCKLPFHCVKWMNNARRRAQNNTEDVNTHPVLNAIDLNANIFDRLLNATRMVYTFRQPSPFPQQQFNRNRLADILLMGC